MQLVSSPRLSARGPAATRTSAAQGGRLQKSKKNVPEQHLVAIFCEKTSETVTKHRVIRSKITLFRLTMPKMAGVWKKKVEFSCFFGVLGLSGLQILLSYFWAAPLQRPKGKKSPQIYIFRPPMGPNPRQPTFYRNRN